MQEISPLLGPVVALVAWTLVMLVWMAAKRGPAMRKAGIKPGRGGRGANLEGVLPDQDNWPAHNYAHLMEQPIPYRFGLFALSSLCLLGLTVHAAARLLHG